MSKVTEAVTLFLETINLKTGDAVYIGKFHPFHKGHLEVVKAALKNNKVKRVIVYVSKKQPNTNATSWKDFGAAASLTKIKAKEFTHPFSLDLRMAMVREGTKGLSVVVLPGDVSDFWNQVAELEEQNKGKHEEQQEKITLIGGPDRAAYGENPNVDFVSVPEIGEGLRATEIRKLFFQYAFDDDEAKLQKALTMVPWSSTSLVKKVKDELQSLSKTAEKLTAPKSK